ncbi:AAA family ATPase [uncultured Phascolarctobacterium sp.]|uniref:AAA family ATPase n=1 Tax=uncultured Phascolarctobacterium sp. TaxID=512296 RepID=UPI0025E1F066|nr:AAA family ATPase [uncultured Phascolarctobacterium sp.]
MNGDPFLLQILNEKRKNNKLTNIIKSIQENQYNIMSSPLNKSFILQGCAGSGKTMILLHRLSILLFNNKDNKLKTENIKIITPSKYFNTQIDQLSNELNIDKVERLTIDDYYTVLLKNYPSKLILNTPIENENLLEKSLLTEIYSTNFQTAFIDSYNNYWKEVLEKINSLNVKALYAKLNLNFPSINKFENYYAQSLKNINKTAISNIKINLKRMSELEVLISDTKKSIDSYTKNITLLDAEFSTQTPITENKLLEDILSTNKNLEFFQTQQLQLEQELYTANENKNSISIKISELEHELQRESLPNIPSYSYDFITTHDNETCNMLLDIFANDFITIRKLKESVAKVPSYAFARRNKLSTELNLAKNACEKKCRDYVETSFSLIKKETEELSQQKQSLEFKISNTNQKLSQINVAINNLSNVQTQLQAYQNLLNQPVYTGLASLPIDYSLSAPEYLKEYNELYTRVNHLKNLIDKESSILTKSENELLVLKEKNISGKDLLTLAECENLIDNLSINQVYNSFYLPIIHNIYITHNEQYSKKYYHHKLYTLLLLCYLYYGKTTLNHNFINIDEAQDMSYAEYNLLKGVLGEKCTFNLYGDVNQAIYSYRSIEDWEEIIEAFNGNFYLLNENYRNTEQITSYCNKTLYSDLKPIGISGPKVKEYYTLQEGIDWIKQYQKNHPKHRCVIITIFNSLNMPNEIQNTLKTFNINWYAGNNNSVSIANVETVKGLEFECVLALTDSMNDNEKYITFTRALSCLAVVNKDYKAELENITNNNGLR